MVSTPPGKKWSSRYRQCEGSGRCPAGLAAERLACSWLRSTLLTHAQGLPAVCLQSLHPVVCTARA